MHAARRYAASRGQAPRRRPSQENAWFRIITRDWDFYVANEVEAFAVITRHDVIDIQRIKPY